MDTTEFITFDLHSFKKYLYLLGDTGLLTIYSTGDTVQIRGNISNDESNITSIMLNKNNIYKINLHDNILIFTVKIACLNLLSWIEDGVITFYPDDDNVKIEISSKIRAIINTDNLYSDDFLELPIIHQTNDIIYEIDKYSLLTVITILEHSERGKTYFKINDSKLSIQSGNKLEFILLDNIISTINLKYKINFESLNRFVNNSKHGSSFISTNGNYKIIIKPNEPLILYINAITCGFYLYMAPFG